MEYADRVKQTVTTTGTGAYDISGSADVGFQKFNDKFSAAAQVFYCAVMGANFEIGVGTISGTTLVRTTIIDSSNTGSAVDWSAGSKDLFGTLPAQIIDELDELNTANGFDLQDEDSQGTITWDNTARKVTLAVKAGQSSFHYWINGSKKVSTAPIVQATAIPDTTGVYYLYLDNDGVLQFVAIASLTAAVFYQYAIVALVYWNATTNKGLFYEERHGYRMSSIDHEMEHSTIGARYSSGFALTGLVDATATFTGCDSGVFFDEDRKHIQAQETTLPFYYRLGADGEWTWTAADNAISFMDGGSDTVWNEWNGSAYVLTPCTPTTDYVIGFVAQTPILTDQGTNNCAVKIIGQSAYSTAAKARAAIETERKALILDGLPSPEFCFVGAYIAKKNGDLVALEDGSTYLDLRGTSSLGSGGSSVASNAAADISISDTGDIITGTNVEDALQENRTAINVNTAKTGVDGEIKNVVEDTTPQLGGNIDLNSKALTNEYTAAVSLVAKDLCYLNSSGKMAKTDADAEATTQGYLALCVDTIAGDATGTFIFYGRLTGYTGLTVGGVCYVGLTAGEMTQTRPSASGKFIRVIGYADSATSIIFQPSPVWAELGT